ncbi:hypothetical protein TSUD_366430 [Trifolium subterraneum]|uniref:Uncharacterized protein n=1 Tax=Trifolium subterraneum TaxID=3900 RepID=A0A2Z6M0L6_TRISU|nr:hypothetical protein TSUD_366430 [Trifolium subterraneum]
MASYQHHHHLDDPQCWFSHKTFSPHCTTSKPVVLQQTQNRILKVTFFLSSVRNKDNNMHTEKGWKKGSLLERNDQDAVDLCTFLPPKTHKTKKRSKRFVDDADVRDVVQSLLAMSRGKSLYVDADNQPRYGKRLKLSH